MTGPGAPAALLCRDGYEKNGYFLAVRTGRSRDTCYRLLRRNGSTHRMLKVNL